MQKIFIFKCFIINYSISYKCTVSCNTYVSKLFSRNDRQSEEFTTLLKEKDDQIAQLLEEGTLTHEYCAAPCSTCTGSRLNRECSWLIYKFSQLFGLHLKSYSKSSNETLAGDYLNFSQQN